MTKQEFIASAIKQIASYFKVATTEIDLLGYASPDKVWAKTRQLFFIMQDNSLDMSLFDNHTSCSDIGSGIKMWWVDDRHLDNGGCAKGRPLKHLFNKSQEPRVIALIERVLPWDELERGKISIWLMPDLAKWRAEENASDEARIAKFAAS